MKKLTIISFVVLGMLSFASCSSCQREKETVVEEIDVTVPKMNDDIINATTINSKGDTLKQEFNNTKGTLMINYKGEKATLKQDTTASGIKYSDNHYEYVEWQGNKTLTKDGKVIFEKPAN